MGVGRDGTVAKFLTLARSSVALGYR